MTYEIQTRHPGHPLRAGWTADGIGDGNEFETVAEAEAMIAQFRQSDDPSWACHLWMAGGSPGRPSPRGQPSPQPWQPARRRRCPPRGRGCPRPPIDPRASQAP